MKTEQWRDIAGYEGLYQVSESGNVKRLPTKGACARERILKPFRAGGRKKYLYVQLCRDNSPKKFLVHRLVAAEFLGDIKGMDVNHKDFNAANNAVENLEIISHADNVLYTVRAGRHARGESFSCSKLTNSDVLNIRTLDAAGYSVPYIAEIYNVSKLSISNVTKGRRWKSIEIFHFETKNNASQLIPIGELIACWDYIEELQTKNLTTTNKAIKDHFYKSDTAVSRLLNRLRDIGSINRTKGNPVITLVNRPTHAMLASWYSKRRAAMLERRATRLAAQEKAAA